MLRTMTRASRVTCLLLGGALSACPLNEPAPGQCEFAQQRGCRPGLVCQPDGGCGHPCVVGAELSCLRPGTNDPGRFVCGDAGWSTTCAPLSCSFADGGACPSGLFCGVDDVCRSGACAPESCTLADGVVGQFPCRNGALVPRCSAIPCTPGGAQCGAAVCNLDGGCGGTPCSVGETRSCTVATFAGASTCGDAGLFGACVARECALTKGVCINRLQRSDDVQGCSALSYGPTYTSNETRDAGAGDGLDNDCDGYFDELDLPDGGPTPCGVDVCLGRDDGGLLKAYERTSAETCEAQLTAFFADAGYAPLDSCTLPNGDFGVVDRNCNGRPDYMGPLTTLVPGAAAVASVGNDPDGGGVYIVVAAEPDAGGFDLIARTFSTDLKNLPDVSQRRSMGWVRTPAVQLTLSLEERDIAHAAYRSDARTIRLVRFTPGGFLSAGYETATLDAGSPVFQGPFVAALPPGELDAGAPARAFLAYATDAGVTASLVLYRYQEAPSREPLRDFPVFGLQPAFTSVWGENGNATFAGSVLNPLNGDVTGGGGRLTASQSTPAFSLLHAEVGVSPLAVAGGRGGVGATLLWREISGATLPSFRFWTSGGAGTTAAVFELPIGQTYNAETVLLVGDSDAGALADGGLTHIPPALAAFQSTGSAWVQHAVFGVNAMRVIPDVAGTPSAAWSPVQPGYALVAAPVRVDGGTDVVGRLVCMPPQRLIR